jgi:hypothetical protein
MDSRGEIYRLQNLAGDIDEATRKHHEAELRRLEAEVGKLVPVSAADLPAVQAMSLEQRRGWYRDRTTAAERKAARKAQRAARKRQRRAR